MTTDHCIIYVIKGARERCEYENYLFKVPQSFRNKILKLKRW